MRTIRPSMAQLALVASIAVLAAACASSTGASPGLTTVGNAGNDLYSGDGATSGEGAPPAAASAAPQPGTGTPDDGVGALVDDAKIIRTGTIELEVKDVSAALLTARDGIRSMGGYVGASRTQNVDDRPLAQITYRIPADRWEEALDLLRNLNGQTTKLVSEQTQAVEVTGQVVDIEARIRNLRASETALQRIATNAVRISDVLEVEQQLTNVRGQIEQLSAQLAELNDRAGYATLTATFSVPIVAVEVASRGWEPGVVVDEASASLLDVLQALTTAGIWFAIVWLPILLVIGVLIAAGIWTGRRLGLIRRRPTGDLPLAG